MKQTVKSPATAVTVAVSLALCAASSAWAAAASGSKSGAAAPASTAPSSDEDKTLYALGVLISRNLETFSLSSAELKMVEQGLSDGANHRPALDADALQA